MRIQTPHSMVNSVLSIHVTAHAISCVYKSGGVRIKWFIFCHCACIGDNERSNACERKWQFFNTVHNKSGDQRW